VTFYRQLLPGDLGGGDVARRGVQVALGDQVLQEVDEGRARVNARVHVDHVVGAAQFEERLGLG